MYIIKDSVTPKINAYLAAQGFKNCMLRYWPQHTVNGQIVFDNLMTWINGSGVVKDDSHMRIYKQLAMNVKSIDSQNHSHLDYTYLYLKASSAPLGTITIAEVQSYIQQFSPLIYSLSKNVFNPDPLSLTDMNPDIYKNTVDALWDNNGWITIPITYQPTQLDQIYNSISNTDILNKVKDKNSVGEIFYDVHNTNRLTALAILDLTTNIVFETQLYISQRNIATKTINLQSSNIGRYHGNTTQQITYIVSVNITLKFRRITDVNVPSPTGTLLTYLTNVINTANSLYTTVQNTPVPTAFSVLGHIATNLYKSTQTLLSTSINSQLSIMCNWVNTYQGNSLIVVNSPTSNSDYYPETSPTSITVSGLTALQPLEFQKQFLKLLTPGYHVHKKKGHWYDVVVSIFIVVILVVALIIEAVFDAEALMPGTIALYASIASLSEVGWAMYLSKNGGSASSIHVTLGIAQVLGIIAMAGVFATGIEQAAAAQTRAKLIQAIAMEIGSGLSIASSVGVVSQNVGMIGGVLALGVDTLAEFMTSTATAATETAMTAAEKFEKFIADEYHKFIAKPLIDIMNNVVSIMNNMFNAYMNLVNPQSKFENSYKDKSLLLQELETQVSNTNPENSENLWKIVNDPYGSIFEVTDYIDKSYPMMTDQLNRNLMNQCYNSGF